MRHCRAGNQHCEQAPPLAPPAEIGSCLCLTFWISRNLADGLPRPKGAPQHRRRCGLADAVWPSASGTCNARPLAATATEGAARQSPADRILIRSTDTVRDGLDRLLPRLWRFCLVLTGNHST